MLDEGAITRLRSLLGEAGYLEAAGSASGDPDVDLRRHGSSEQLRLLLTLFAAGQAVPFDGAEAIFGIELLQALQSSGLISHEAASVSSNYRVSVSDGLLLVHDPLPPLEAEHVTGVNGAAITLAHLTMRRATATALDVGTGCGYQALLSAPHSGKVVATDILDRAISLTSLNAGLNGLTNIECRQGSFFEPVEGQRFELIVCNPPFIISPDSDYVFRDGGLRGHEVSEAAVKGAAEHLAEGGFATVLVNWGLVQGQTWDEPGRLWLAGSGCDAIFVRYATLDGLEYAATWNAHLAGQNRAQYRENLERWPRYLDELEFEQITEVGVILRRRRGGNWVAAFEAISGPTGAASDQLERIFANQDWLRSHGGELLQHRFVLVAGHHLDQRMTFIDGSYSIADATMHLSTGAGLVGGIPADLVPLLFALATVTAHDAVVALSQELDVEPAGLLDKAEAVIRQLFERGLLELAR